MASSSSLSQWQSGIRNGNALETVEIDPQFASSLGFPEDCLLEIGLLHDLDVAITVSAEPVSSDDWEILELHAGFVEDNLLSQVRVACVGQEVDVWVLGRTRVRFRVVSFDPPGSAVLLTTNTEVSIAPKLRSKTPAVSSKSQDAKVSPSPKASASGFFPQTNNHVILRVLPFRLVSNVVETTEDCGAWVSPTTFVNLTNEQLLPSESFTTALRPRLVSVRRLRPLVPPKSGRQALQDLPSPSFPAKPRVIHKEMATGEPAPIMDESTKTKNTVSLHWSEEIPDYQIVLQGVEGIEDWDLARVQSLNNEDTNKALMPSKKLTLNASPSTSPFIAREISSQQFNTLAGVDSILQECYKIMINAFASRAQLEEPVPSGLPSLLLCGRTGSGRTSIVKAVMERLGKDPKVFAYTHYIDLTKYSEERIPVLKSLFQYWLDVAKWHQPSIIVLDNLERIIPAELEHTDSFRSRHLAEHFISVFGSKHFTSGVVLFATCQSQATVHPLLMSTHLFSWVEQLKPPNKDARRDILAGIVQSKIASSRLQLDPEHTLNYVFLATQTEGYLATDLHDLVLRAIHHATIRAVKDNSGSFLRTTDFEKAQVGFTPLSLRDVKLQTSDIAWSDIGGLHETRRVLRETLEWPSKYAAIFANSPLRLRSGLLLYGFPGCGKTLLASAVAKECGLNFISVKGPELLNKYIGASEKSVRDLFERASAAKPCILFFDEFDSIAPKRGHDSTGVTDRIVNQLLTQMDGAEGLDGVYVLAATSRPDLIDSALLRPGRLDKSLLCSMPDVHERKEIMQAICRKVAISPSVDLERYAQATVGFSGADLQALIYNAHLEVVHSAIDSAGHRNSADPDLRQEVQLQYTFFGGTPGERVSSRAEKDALSRRIETIVASQAPSQCPDQATKSATIKSLIQDEHMQKSLQSARTSVPPQERERLSRIYREFVSGRSGPLPVPPDSGGIGTRISLM